MNFLSHFYFERYASSPERVVGSILPDLLKNADKGYVFHPNRFEEQLFAHPLLVEVYKGWYRHVEVDKLFHSSEFFVAHNHQLRQKLDPILEDLPIRASFMGHIAIELLLDHLLIRDKAVNVARLYEHLENVNRTILTKFLHTIGLEDVGPFMEFYDKFIEWRYVFEYEDISGLHYPLFNIAKRVWVFEADEIHREALTQELITYLQEHLTDYKSIYQYIQDNLTV